MTEVAVVVRHTALDEEARELEVDQVPGEVALTVNDEVDNAAEHNRSEQKRLENGLNGLETLLPQAFQPGV